VIRGRTELIAREADDEFADHAREAIEAADRIISTAANAAEIREVVDARDATVSVDLRNAVTMAVSQVSDSYPDAEVTVDGLPDVTLSVHPRFGYAVRHAVENGIEHHDGSDPQVSVSGRREAGGVAVEVEDRGPGIPDVEVEPLDAGEETQVAHGSGAGLWVLDRVVRYSGGAVDFESDDDGTTVRIRLGPSAVVE
jgi:signal transduction histidine kinase